MKTRILIVEPQPVTRQGIALTLQAEPDLEVCGQACCAEGAFALFAACEPDLVVTALDLGDRNGLDLVHELVRQRPSLPVLVLSRHAEALCAERAFRAGARGYAVKHEPADTIVAAVRRLAAGRFYVSDSVVDELLVALARSRHPLIPAPTDVLSERELELFELIGAGLTTHDIAEAMHLSVKTVESYRNRIKQKLNVDTMADLMRRAVMWKSPDHAAYAWNPPPVGGEKSEARNPKSETGPACEVAVL